MCRRLGKAVEKEMGARIPRVGACWMSKTTILQITESSGGHRPDVLCRVTVVRLLAFLASPTAEHWDFLTEGEGMESPFSHACNRGAQAAGQVGCINALQHGRFTTRLENESHEGCGGARIFCSGHGSPAIKCIFTHDDGFPQPCRMMTDHVPACRCPRPCF